MFARVVVSALLLCLALFSFGQDSARKIQKLDKLKVTCEEESLLSKTYKVSKDGILLIDFLGAVEVAGMTEAEAGETISKRLVEERILRKATVQVKLSDGEAPAPGKDPSPSLPTGPVVKYSGSVKTAGELTFKEGLTVGDVATAAGVGPETDLTKTIVRSAAGKTQLVDATATFVLGAGDEVVFTAKAPEPPLEVYVFGGVANPGTVKLGNQRTVRAAITEAGGFVENSVKSKVRIERDGETAQTVDLSVESNDATLRLHDRIVIDVMEKRAYVQVEGAVNTPGFFVVTPGMKLGEALSAAGGYTNGAQLEKVLVYSPGKKKPLQINYREIEQGYSGDIVLGAGDKVSVPGQKRRNDSGLRLAVGAAAIWYLIGR